ncbi:hypothetical protein SCLCIDRAFT_520093 [Scleroderma citrinum Foug A]|uniref:Uncharacterized protein n=1 Tax=Scleroderma citrinum Foug A TaxID=1036808 RepID=A0A0C3ER39_9AGAM|nr:hypothetical protein SCLCIDRAFT_520093 [Scleroderma citrinum Foug A]
MLCTISMSKEVSQFWTTVSEVDVPSKYIIGTRMDGHSHWQTRGSVSSICTSNQFAPCTKHCHGWDGMENLDDTAKGLAHTWEPMSSSISWATIVTLNPHGNRPITPSPSTATSTKYVLSGG